MTLLLAIPALVLFGAAYAFVGRSVRSRRRGLLRHVPAIRRPGTHCL